MRKLLAVNYLPVHLIHDIATWAQAIADLPASGLLPCRNVLVFNERTAHALRKELVTSGQTSVLAGTRFLTSVALATELLAAADSDFHPETTDLSATRIARVFRQGLPLHHFRCEFLAETPGWDVAFARTLRDLESAALRPKDLRFARAPAQLLDVAAVWEAVDQLAGPSWSSARIIAEAASLLASDPSRWTFAGPTLATLAPMFTAGEARLVKAIPGAQLAMFAARPLRAGFLERIGQLLGDDAVQALSQTPLDAAALAAAAGPARTERDVLAASFLDTPEALALPGRPRSRGVDGTVHLEEHAGVEAEVEAAADWVARQILEHKLPLDRIAVLVPRAEPLAAMIGRRIGRLGFGTEQAPVPVFVAGGLPLLASTAGARVLAVLNALQQHLPVELVAEILTTFRPVGENALRLSRSRAYEVAYALGTAGGNASDPAAALSWAERVVLRGAQLEQELAASRDAADLRRGERLLQDLRASGPALLALSELARRILGDAPLSELWLALEQFMADWMLLPPDASGVPFPALLAAARERTLPGLDAEHHEVRGSHALAWLIGELHALRVPGARFGDPAVYVGTIRSAAGLSFDAVRIVGLAEGHWPSVSREDPVLPDRLRELVPTPGLQTTTARSLAQLHALGMVVRGAQRSLVFSMARIDVDRSQREPSPIFLEVASALGRPGPGGEPAPTIADLRLLRRDAFLPARLFADEFRNAWPLSAAAWQWRVARYQRGPHSTWAANPALDLERVRELAALGFAPTEEGLFGSGAELDAPGLAAEKPISASGLRELLRCPHKFMLERVLGWREPVAASQLRELDALAYGTIFHAATEDLYRLHGEELSARKGTLEVWQGRADAIAEAALASFLESHPLLGEAVRARQLARLQADLRLFLEDEWNAPVPSLFVAAEHAFGYDQPEPVDLGKSTLFVRGRIDRIDVEGRRLMVRDLKTGRAHPRRGEEAEPDPLLDLQIGLYALVAKPMAKKRRLALGASYVYTGAQPSRERAFREDIDALEAATLDWLRVAEGVLRERAFVRTPIEGDCAFCPFVPVCGTGFHARVAELLEAKRRGPLRALRVLKLGADG